MPAPRNALFASASAAAPDSVEDVISVGNRLLKGPGAGRAAALENSPTALRVHLFRECLHLTVGASKVHLYGQDSMTIGPHSLGPVEDIPLGNLPSADPTLLGKAPLEVAVFEIRFTAHAGEITPETAAALRDELVENTGVDYPTIQPTVQQQMRIDFGANGVSQVAAESRGWQIVSADGAAHITLMPDVLIIQLNRYERWSTSMKAPITVLVESLGRLIKPSLVHRIGLRYVDRFHDSGFDSAAAWRGRIDDTLLGPVLNPAFGGSVRGAQQQVEIRLDDHHGALLRHGPVHDDAGKCVQYLLDTDVFRHSSFTFDVREVVVSAERLNRTALSLFQASVTETYLKELREGGEA